MSWARGLLTAIRFIRAHNTLSFFLKERTCAKKEKRSINEYKMEKDGEIEIKRLIPVLKKRVRVKIRDGA